MSSSLNISVKSEYTEEELRGKAAPEQRSQQEIEFIQTYGVDSHLQPVGTVRTDAIFTREGLNHREQLIREELRGVVPNDSIDTAVREERERSIGTPGEVQTYRFAA